MKKTKIQSDGHNNLESRTIRSKVREITAISLFTIVAAASSILLADLIVFPLTHFAVNNVNIFNLIFKNLLLVLIIIILIYTLIKKYNKLAEEGLLTGPIILYFLKRPFHYIGLLFSFLFISIIMISVLYILFSLNYYYLYKISGGV